MTNARTENVDSADDKFQLVQPRAIILHALRNPFSVGAVASASPHLVNEMLSQVECHADVIVELGAGTGVITQALVEGRNHRRGVVSIEIDPHLADIAGARLAGSAEVIVGDALELSSFFTEGQVDSIVCSLPLTLLSSGDLEVFLAGVSGVLKDGGVFVFYLYQMGFWNQRYKRVVQHARLHFSSVCENPIVWRNLPPARVIVCR